MLIPEDARASRSRDGGGETIGELLHIRERHQRIHRQIEHALLGSFDLNRARTDERPTSDLATQQTATLSLHVCASHRCERDAELTRENTLSRKPASGLEATGFDLPANGVGDRLVDWTAPLSPGRELNCHACNMSLDCLQCQDTIHSITEEWRQSPYPPPRTSCDSEPMRSAFEQASCVNEGCESRCRSSRFGF